MPEPITLSEAKNHMRIDPDDESQDTIIAVYITANREYMEKHLNLSLVPKTELEYKFNRGCLCVNKYCYIPYGPVADITSVKDKDGEDVTYQNIATDEFPKLCVDKSVTVVYDAGYDAETIPSALKLALLMMVADSYENRENTSVKEQVYQIPFGAKQLMYPFSRNSLL